MFPKKQSVYAILALFLFTPAFGATMAFLKKSIHRDKIEKSIGMYENTIMRPLLENEARYKKDYFICYHGMSSDGRLLMEVFRNLYEIATQTPLRTDFEFLRFWGDGSDYENVTDFLNEPSNKDLSDHMPHIRPVLVSANLSVFANYAGESTWLPFIDNRNKGSLSDDYARRILEDLFEKIGCDARDIATLLAIDAEFKTKAGDLLQIMIPKKIQPKCAYPAVPGGASLLDRNDPSPKEDGYYDFAKVTDEMISKLDKLQARLFLDKLQARLFFAKSGPLLNPEFGVKIIDFNTLEPEKLAAYKLAVKEAVHNMVARCTKIEKPTTAIPSSSPPQEPPPLTKEEAADIEDIMTWIREYSFSEIVTTDNPIPELRKSLDRGTNIDSQLPGNDRALVTAIKEGKVDVVEFLLINGANPNPKRNTKVPESIVWVDSPLKQAITKGNLPIVQLLIRFGANMKFKDGNTALRYAEEMMQLAHRYKKPKYAKYAEILAYLQSPEAKTFVDKVNQLLRVRLYPALDFADRRNLRAILKRIKQKKPDAVELFTTIVKHLAVNQKEQARNLTQNAYGGSSYWGGDFPASNLEHKEWRDAIIYALDNADFSFLTMYHPDQQEEQDLHDEQQKQEEHEHLIQEEMLKPLNRGSTS